MGSADEQAKRKALRQRYRAEQRKAAWTRLGLTREQLDDLLKHLDHRLAEPCDETLVMTRRWAEDHGVPWSRLEIGLHDSGAGCDCEVLANVDPDENL
jgi:hypothetical protein